MQFAIGEGRLQLNFQKHPNQIKAPETDAAQLAHFRAADNHLISYAKSLLRRRTRLAVQIHAIHQHVGDMNIGFGDATFGFGQMPHHLKGGGEKQRLPLLLIGKHIDTAAARPVKYMADQQAQHHAPKACAHHQRDRNANYFTQILHRLPNLSAAS
jgi:hypothetical protein